MDLSLVPYQQKQPRHERETTMTMTIKYRECMRNHAASIGGHANDGCGEFMPRAEDTLACAACGCHRNFHRREAPPGQGHPITNPPSCSLLLLKTNTISNNKHSINLMGSAGDVYHDDYDRRSETPERDHHGEEVMTMNLNAGPSPGGRSSSSKSNCKRHRTKFTQEQKDKMFEFAERIGWRMQRHDDVALNQFCSEIGVTRQVLKVWMHNNKNNATHRRSGTLDHHESASDQSPITVVPTPPPSAQPAGV